MAESAFPSRIPVELRIDDLYTLTCELQTFLAPRTVDRILSLLPIDSRLHIWSQQAYFGVGAKMGTEKTVTRCRLGDLAYWSQGDAICIFLQDMTPMSKVNPIGLVTTSSPERIFEKIKAGMVVRFSRS